MTYFRELITSQSQNGLCAWWQQVSGGNLDLSASTVFGWYTLSHTAAQVITWDRGTLVANARAAATATGADLSSYLHTLAIVAGFGPPGGNVGSDIATAISVVNQDGWRWCAKCEGLAFFDGTRPPGPCIAGGTHDHSSSSFYALAHDTSFTGGQPGWSWCNKCEALIFRTSTPAPCPAGGAHSLPSGFNYVLREDSTAPGEQQNWKWCKKCQALAYDGTGQPGPCPLGGRHDHTGSGNYSLLFGWNADLGFFAHESGHGFGLDHSFGTGRSGDFGNDGRPGVYGDWFDIMSWARTASFTAPLFTPVGAGPSTPTLNKLGWLADQDVVTYVKPPLIPIPTSTVTLRPVYGSPANGNPRMVRVIDPAQGWVYTSEFRAPQSCDQGVGAAQVVVHAMRTLYQAGQDGWRLCHNCQGLIYAGQTQCPSGGVHDDGGSGDYWVSLNAGSNTGQTNWRWCKNCSGLFYNGGTTRGACPAGGAHDGSESGNYALPTHGVGQSNWKWCNKCQGLAFAGSSSQGVCPAGGLHDHTGSSNYVTTTSSTSGHQSKWRWCNKCQGLYYAGLGTCKGGDVHAFSDGANFGFNYAPVNGFQNASGQSNWLWCSKCYGMSYYDGSRAVGACAAGGVHDYPETTQYYVIPTDPETQAGQRHWYFCTKCFALNYVDSSRGPGLCSAGGNHAPDRAFESLIAHDTSAVPGATNFRWCRKCEVMVAGDNPASCAASGNHDTSGSFHYVVRTDPASLVSEGAFWRTCVKCSALIQLASADGTNNKPCPAGGTHSPTGEYFVTFLTGDARDLFWRWCRKCESMAYWDESNSPGPCPAGGTHDHSGSGFYAPPSFWRDGTQVVGALTTGQSWSNSSNSVGFEVTAMDSNSATVLVFSPGVSINVPGVLFTGQSASGTVTLNEPAPSGGTTVKLSVSNPSGEVNFVTVPATVVVPGAATSATFQITTPATAFGFGSIGAVLPDADTQAVAPFVISKVQIALSLPLPDQGPSIAPGEGGLAYIKIGHTATGTIYVRNPPPAPGDLVTLTTNENKVVSITPTVVHPTTSSGSTSGTFTVTALSVGEFTISAHYVGDSATIGPFPALQKPPTPPTPPHPPGPGPKPI